MRGKPFTKGKSGNPGGRPKVVAEVRDLARQHTEDAVKALVSIMKGKTMPAAARVSAATAILDRGYGKPTQALEHTDQTTDPVDSLSAFELARQIAFLLAKGAHEKEEQDAKAAH